jgi:hypothetical protein
MGGVSPFVAFMIRMMGRIYSNIGVTITQATPPGHYCGRGDASNFKNTVINDGSLQQRCCWCCPRQRQPQSLPRQ